MAQDDIQGQVVDAQGNPVDGAIVELTKSYQSSPDSRGNVFRTTTDSNGNYIFTGHQEGDGTTQEWHVSCYNHDGTAYVNSFNNPGVTADLPSNAIPDSGVYFDFESGTLPPNIKERGSAVSNISTSSFFGSYSWLSDGGGPSDINYLDINNDGTAHDEIYIEAWWKNPLDGRVDFFETATPTGNGFDLFNDGSSYYHFDGSRRFLFNINQNEWYRSEIYYNKVTPQIDIKIYDTNNNLIASRTDGSPFNNGFSESMLGPSIRNSSSRLFVDEIFAIPSDYRGNEKIVSVV